MKRASDDEWVHDPELLQALEMSKSSSTGAPPGPLLDFDLRPVDGRRNWRNVLHKQRYQARVQQHRDPSPGEDLGQELTDALRRTIGHQIRADPTLTPHATVHFTMQSDAFSHAFQSTTFTVGEFTEGSERLETYLQTLASQLNSNQEFAVNDTFTLETTFIRTPGPGAGRSKNQRKMKPGKDVIHTLLKKKKSIVYINNTDDLCCARALVTMQALADAGGDTRDPDYVNLNKGRPIQERRALQLHQQAGVPEGPCGLKELHLFQQALPGYQIKVLAADKPHMIVFCGPDAAKILRLVKVDGHYHGCNSFKGFLGKSYFCDDCNRGYDQENIAHHPCKGKWCPSCERSACRNFQDLKATLEPGKFPTPSIPCSSCNRCFFGEDCHASHKQITKTWRSLCQRKRKCLVCKRMYDAAPMRNSDSANNIKYRHRCGWGECPFCEEEVEVATHRCFIQPVDPDDDVPKLKKVHASEVGDRPVVHVDPEDGMCWVERSPPLFVYADYEAITDDDGVQTPILVCCEAEDEDDTQSFYGPTCTEDLFDYLDGLTIDEYGEERGVIVVFHNFKGYDGMFVLQYLYSTHREVEDQICVGTKVLSLKSDNLTFKDSLCFLPMPLSSFPATFGLTEMCKGFFPHLFNTAANQTYVGPMPEERFYDPDGMSAKKKEEFQRWHAEKVAEGYVFRLRHEMEQYCISDVKLLKAGCEKFQSEFFEHAEFRPMEKCVTIASACNRFWRKKMLPHDTIAVEPPRGWHGARTNTSVKARQWLAWEEHVLRCQADEGQVQTDRIRHAYNGGEVRVFTPAQSYLVDGYDEQTRTVYEFHGCLWHGCPACFPNRTQYSKFNADRSFQEVYEATLAKHDILRREGYTVQVMWECQWKWLLSEYEEKREFVSELELMEPLDPRNAFFGGRTNAATLYHKADEQGGEQIRYVDVTSLYPWVNANGKYPVGHPIITTNPDDQNISSYFGVALVDVLPPHKLYHPVLPHRQGGKLTFPLCRSCVEQEMAKPMLERSSVCKHSDGERMLRGTWCTPEIQKAVAMGYTIVHIHEVWHFEEHRRGLFANYVKQWLKVKQESAGYPGWANTAEKQTQYRTDYLAKEGIRLDPDFMVKNPGRKATAKLMLNSFWGKFGENLHKPQVYAVDTPAALFQLLSEPLHEVQTIRIVSDERLELVCKDLRDNQLDNGKRNIFVAAFTTCLARLKLYESLEILGEQALYFDTDSVIYRWRPGAPEIPLGDYLGDMTDELDGQGYITEFVSGGPKNYGYTTSSGKVCCKVRGFTLNVRGARQLNYEVMRGNVLDEILDPQDERRITLVKNPHFFTRHPATKKIKIIPRDKQYRLVFDKRVVETSNFNSYPYGYTPFLDDADVEMVDDLVALLE